MTASEAPCTDRAAELVAALAALDHRLRAACAAAGRDRDELTVVVVAKTFPASDVLTVARAGALEIGENREQELREKAAAVAEALAGDPLSARVRWHMLGRLQRNKGRSVGRTASVVHSVDRAELLAPLARGAGEAGRVLDVLVQVSLDGDPARGGIRPDAVGALATAVAATEHLRLRGVMAVAPLGTPPRPAFAVLREVSAALRREHPDAGWISAGMSGDLEDAVAEGATHVRVGSAVFGRRPSVVG